MASYRIYTRAADYSRLGELDTYQQFKAFPQINDVGTWALTAPNTAHNARILTETGGIVVTRDGQVIFSGPTVTRKPTRDSLSLTGFDDMVILLDNPAYPVPTESGPTFSLEADVRTGIASTLMIEYVRANIGPAAVAGVYVSELGYAADPFLGTSGAWRARFPSLLKLLQEIAWSRQGGGLRFNILQNEIGSAALTFTVSQPLDRRTPILINRERGTLGAFTASYKAPAATHILMLGQGVGADRVMVTATNAAAEEMLGRRIVKVVDRRDIEDPDELQQAADTELLNSGMQRSIAIEPLATSAVIWGRDYDLGDIVTVSAGDQVMDEVVRGVALTLEAKGAVATVQPIISSPQGSDDDPDGVAARIFRALDERTSNLERNVPAPLPGSITGGMLDDDAVVGSIGPGDISGTMLASGAAAANIGTGGVSAAMLASGAAASNVGTGGVSAAMLASGAAASNIGTGGVSAAMLAAGAAASNVGTGGVSAAMLAAGAALSNLGYTPSRITSGTYSGNSSATQDITLAFTPVVVLVSRTGKGIWLYLSSGKVAEILYDDTQTELTTPIITNGFRAIHPGNNESGNTYEYVAIG